MNILHLHNYFNITCGISKNISNIASSTDNNHKHFVCGFGGDALEQFYNEQIDVSLLDPSPKFIQFISNVIQLRKIIRNKNIDIIHSHNRFMDFLAYIVQSVTKVKTVMSVHSIVSGNYLVSYRSPKLIAVSESVKQHLITYFNIAPQRIIILNNCIMPERYKVNIDASTLRNEYGIKSTDFLFLFAGRFDKEKGVDNLIFAFSELSAKNDKIKLLMIGEGSELEFLKQHSRIANQNIFILPPKNNMADFYNASDAVILPSRVDPFPFVMLEAGLFSKTFIGTKVDGISEMIADGKTGILCAPGNIAELAQSMSLVINSSELRDKLGGNLYLTVMGKYTFNNYIIKLNDIYASL